MKGNSHARYFSLIIDSTSGVSNTDQLAFVMQYVLLTNVCANEHLLKLLPGVCHKFETLEGTTLCLLDELKLDINNCHRQSYDNALNMSVAWTGH